MQSPNKDIESDKQYSSYSDNRSDGKVQHRSTTKQERNDDSNDSDEVDSDFDEHIVPTQSELDDEENENDKFKIESYSVGGHTDRSDLELKNVITKISPRPVNLNTPKMKAVMISDNLPKSQQKLKSPRNMSPPVNKLQINLQNNSHPQTLLQRDKSAQQLQMGQIPQPIISHHTKTAMLKATPAQHRSQTSGGSVSPMPRPGMHSSQSNSIIPASFAARISLKEQMRMEANLTPQQVEHQRHLAHMSGEERRSMLRAQRKQNMEQYLRQEKNLSVIQQLEEISSQDSDDEQSGISNQFEKKNKILNSGKKIASGDKSKEQLKEKKQKRADKKKKEEEDKKKPKKRLIFNTYNTNYPVIDLAAKNLGYKTIFKDHNLVPSPELKAANKIAPGIYANISPEDFDVVWFDLTIKEEVLQKIKSHQRVSQWCGVQVISNKGRLAKNLNLMRKAFPREYNFFPQSFVLPQEINDFRKALYRNQTFIVKPSHDCQGRGIYLARNIGDFEDEGDKPMVAQTYVDNPLLIDKLKFDLRLYVLLAGIHPLRIYLFNDGLARFATTPYVSSAEGDIKDLFMHLTNYAINKKADNYVANENFDGGTGSAQNHQNNSSKPQNTEESTKAHKRSLQQIYQQIEEMGLPTDKLKQDIKDLVVKTLITGQSHLHHIYKTCHPDDVENQMCFQILGFDVMIDSKLKPWLIEVNQSPSFATDSAFDFTLKKQVMEDTFRLLNLTPERKQRYVAEREKFYIERLMTANKGPKLSYEEKEYKRYQIDKERDRSERNIIKKTQYELIFPIKNDEYKIQEYNQLINKSREIQESFIHGKKNMKNEANVYDYIYQSAQQKSGTFNAEIFLNKEQNKNDNKFKSALKPFSHNTEKPKKKKEDKEQKWDHLSALKPKKELDYQRLNVLENIQTQKEEQKMKDKTVKKQVSQTMKQQKINNYMDNPMKKDMVDEVENMIKAQQHRDKLYKERLENQRIEAQKKQAATIENLSTSPISKFQFQKPDANSMKNPYTKYTQYHRTKPSDNNSQRSKSPKNNKDRSTTPNYAVQASPMKQKNNTIQNGIDKRDGNNSKISMMQFDKLDRGDNKRNNFSIERPILADRSRFGKDFSPKVKNEQVNRNRNISQNNYIKPISTVQLNNFIDNKKEDKTSANFVELTKQNDIKKDEAAAKEVPTRTFFLAKFLPGSKKEVEKQDSKETRKEEINTIKEEYDSRQSRKDQHQQNKESFKSNNNTDYSVEPQKPRKAEPIIFSPEEPQLMTIKERKEQSFKSKPMRQASPMKKQSKRDLTPLSQENLIDENEKERSQPIVHNFQSKSILGYNEENKPNHFKSAFKNEESRNSITNQPSNNVFKTTLSMSITEKNIRIDKSINFRDTIAQIEKSDIKKTADYKLQEEKDKIKKNNSNSIKDISKRSFGQSKIGTDTNSTIVNKERYIIGGGQDSSKQGSIYEPIQISDFEESELEVKPKRSKRPKNKSISSNNFGRESMDGDTEKKTEIKKIKEYEKELQKLQRVDQFLKTENKKVKTQKNNYDFLSPHKQEEAQDRNPMHTPQQVSKKIEPEISRTNNPYISNSALGMFKKYPERNLGSRSPRKKEEYRAKSPMKNKFNKSQFEPKEERSNISIDSKNKQFSVSQMELSNPIQQNSIMSPNKNNFVVQNRNINQKANKIADKLREKQNWNNREMERIKTLEDQVKAPNIAMISEPDLQNSPIKNNKLKEKVVKKIPNQNRAREQFCNIIDELKRSDKDPIFDLDKDFTVNQVIGKGTFAVIKKATHNTTGYQVALKTYQKKLLTRKSQLMAIHREIYILAGLNHPNIMKLFEVIDTRTHVNLIMQLCSGPNLLDYQKRFGEKLKFAHNKVWTVMMSEEIVKPLFKQLVSAIDYMHKLGLVHRDLRIENIIINEMTKEVKFIDFGFATSFQANKQLQMIGGTPQIKNPEIIKSKTLTCQLADIYSMGIILFIMLTGGVPHWALIESEQYPTIQSEKNYFPIKEDNLTGQWYEIYTQECQDIFKQMITCDAQNQMTMEDILNCEWLKDVEIPIKSAK